MTMRNNTKKAIAGVTVTLGMLIGGGFSYHEYKVISDENEKLTGKVHSQGMIIFEQNDLLMKNNQYISELKSTKKQVEDENKKVKAILDKQNKKVKKLEKKIDSLEKEVSPTVSSVGGTTLGKYTVTAYTNNAESTGKSPGDPAYGITASGKQTQEGVTLSCPKDMKFGTKLYIEGVGVRECSDTGSAIVSGTLDLYIADLGRAREFGRQKLEVKLINS